MHGGNDRLRDTGVMERVKAFACDLVQPIPEGIIYELGNKIDFIVHMAAETHVDNSIADRTILYETTWTARFQFSNTRESSSSKAVI